MPRKVEKNVQGWFSLSGSASYLGASTRTIYDLMQTGQLTPFYRVGSKRRWFRKEQLDALHRPAVTSAPLQMPLQIREG